MSKFYMALTFLVLPIYWVRAWWLRKHGTPEKIDKELKRYPRHYLGLRRKKVIAHHTHGEMKDTCIYLCNHQSMNDIFITLDSVRQPFRYIAKTELFTNPITGMFMKMSSSYPLDREDPRQSLLVLKQAVQDVSEGHSVLAFPEGTRSHQKEMLPFKDGIFSMLRKGSVPMVPMYIKESFNEKQKAYHVYFGEPISPEIYGKMKGVELSEFVRSKMEGLKTFAYQ